MFFVAVGLGMSPDQTDVLKDPVCVNPLEYAYIPL
jgi:hypothetical protein